MGQVKREMEKWADLSCQPIGDKHICPDCVGDYALKEFIQRNAQTSDCDYCGEIYAEDRCAEADTVIEHVAGSISYEFEDPVHSVGYCSAEGGYLLPTMDSAELLSQFDLGEFTEDAENSLDGLWVEKDPYGDRPWEYLLSSWGSFSHHVKHSQRFFFHRAPSSTAPYLDDTPNSSILDQVAEVAAESGMIKKISAGSVFYRARQHEASDTPSTASELGTPPAEFAVSSNRMSPAGIPMFYAAMDQTTARAETESSSPTKRKMTIGAFAPSVELTILDLAKVPGVPSLFDEDRRHLRAGLKFIRGFADDLALPITRDGREHIDYVPTQLVSEYFRTVFKLSNGQHLDGLSYRSAKNPGGVCLCLFFDHEDFEGDGDRSTRAPSLLSTDTIDLGAP